MSNTTIQNLYDGLQSTDFRRYVNAINDALRSILDNYDELCWYPNDEESIEMIMEGLNWSAYDLLSFSAHYNFKDNFVRVNAYGYLETISYSGLADLYEELLFDVDYLDLVEELLEEISL